MAAAAGVGLSHYFFSDFEHVQLMTVHPTNGGIMAAMHFRWVCRRWPKQDCCMAPDRRFALNRQGGVANRDSIRMDRTWR
jgi:hypothetical protein